MHAGVACGCCRCMVAVLRTHLIPTLSPNLIIHHKIRVGTKTYNDRQIDDFANRSLSMALDQAQARFTIYAWASASVFAMRRVATGSAYKMIWTRVAYAGIEIISIPAYAHVATRIQIILYANPAATLAQAYMCEPGFRPKKAYMAAEANYEYQ